MPTNAWYRVYAWLPNIDDASSAISYTIIGSDTVSMVQVDQATAPKGWTHLGSTYLTAGNHKVVTLDTETAEDGKRCTPMR